MIDIEKARALVDVFRDQSQRIICQGTSPFALKVADLIDALMAERDALARDAARFDWYFGPNVLKPADFMSEYLRGVREQWTPDQWRAAIDAAMKGASGE